MHIKKRKRDKKEIKDNGIQKAGYREMKTRQKVEKTICKKK